MSKKFDKLPIEGNEAVAKIAYKMSDAFMIYPITPSSPMGELVDQFSAKNDKNIFGSVPSVTEMQSEGGAAGALHGALQTGGLACTFTCSQGLLLMIPNIYKIAGELTPCVIHVASRSLATAALSIYGDHQDVMLLRPTGVAMLSSGSVQEAQDNALISHLATLESRIPFIHFFDGFRTSHEINKIELIDDETIKSLIKEEFIIKQRSSALKPDAPQMGGAAQNIDTYFQGREASNNLYEAIPSIVQKYFDEFAKLTGRQYDLFDYYGDEKAESIIVIMGSGTQAVRETVEILNKEKGNVGVLQVRLFNPFSAKDFVKKIPASVKIIAVLDRTKEPGTLGEPLYLDVVAALKEEKCENVTVIGGRYGLSSKEFTPAMAKAIFDELKKSSPKQHFTVGINDDVSHLSLDYKDDFVVKRDDIREAIFFGLGSDGTVGANKNTIKIICDREEYYGQAYFVYDSKKSGSITESHLRFGKNPINSTYLVQQADFIGCHQFNFLFKIDILGRIKKGGTLLLNTYFSKDEVWDQLPKTVQKIMIERDVKLYIIDAYDVAEKTKMGTRINTIMQTCFFKLAQVMDTDEAIGEIKKAIVKTYSKKGQEIVDNNIRAVDDSLSHLVEVDYPKTASSKLDLENKIPSDAPDFVKKVTAKMIAGQGETLKVSEVPVDGRYPTDTSRYEKRDVAEKIAVWNSEKCIECGLCVVHCPHSCLETKVFGKKEIEKSPPCFKVKDLMTDKSGEKKFRIQISPEDCTGCSLCSVTCPVGAIEMKYKSETIEDEKTNLKFFDGINGINEVKDVNNLKDSQFKESLFKYSGACAGCGETPYLSLLTRLFGERMLVANATGCSSIFGGNLPTTPWSKNKDGRGPAWSNSLFEDNAEYGFGMKISEDIQRIEAVDILEKMKEQLGTDAVNFLIENCDKSGYDEIETQKKAIKDMKKKLASIGSFEANHLSSMLDIMLRRSNWIVGGDGWAYDIDFGGLDHIIASGKNINILVMDTEVYSNTGGQASKATPIGASAKFTVNGKQTHKKDLGAIAMTYDNVYVAQVAIRANPAQTLKALKEAEAYNGPSIVIAYSSCIAHGIPLEKSFTQQKNAVDSGLWMLYRYNPDLLGSKKALQIDSKEPNIDLLETYLYAETRFNYVKTVNPSFAEKSVIELKKYINSRWNKYKVMSENL
jgi:pyruvate-ferredoxin/flavodoxin oxidoreductase